MDNGIRGAVVFRYLLITRKKVRLVQRIDDQGSTQLFGIFVTHECLIRRSTDLVTTVVLFFLSPNNSYY